MAPIVKMMSSTGYTYEKNNFAAFVDTVNAPEAYHTMMNFVKKCKLSYAMTATTPLIHEIIEEVWASAEYNGTDGTISFSLQGNNYVVNSDVLTACFKLPENNCLNVPSDAEIVAMLNSINYALSTENLGKIVRKGMVKEWSYFCDAFIKTFSGKISNFDAVTHSMLVMLCMLLNDKFYNFSTLVMYELAAKLGKKETRSKNIYFARFLMLLALHVSENGLTIANPNSKFSCFVQEKRVLSDLIRMDLNAGVQLVYLPIVQVTVSNLETPISNPQISLPSRVTMESVVVTKQAPTQVAKSKISKSQSKKKTSGVSQKALVAKPTKTLEGSVKEVVSGEGQGANPKDKEGEAGATNISVSQQTVNEPTSQSLVTSSQQGVTIGSSSTPGTLHKRVRDTTSPLSKTYGRRVKSKTTGESQGAHTAQQTVPSQIQFDVASINVESQPLDLNIQLDPYDNPSSPTLSLDVDMISTSFPDSPSLRFLEKPHSKIGGHHLLDELLDHQSSFPEISTQTVASNLKSISTDSVLVFSSTDKPFSSSTDILHPLTSVSPSTDVYSASHPLTVQISTSTDIFHPLTAQSTLTISTTSDIPVSSVEELVVIETLIGMRGGSERLPCEQAKGELNNERLAISSGQEKGENESSTLVGEGEGVSGVSQGEPLMQEKRDERREGTTGDIRVEGAAIASESMKANDALKEMEYQREYQSMVDSISLDAETFTHPVSAYQIMAQQGNVEAEEAMHLVHTSQSLQRAKESLAALPSSADSEEFGESEEEDSQNINEEIPIDRDASDLPDWLFSTNTTYRDFNVEVLKQYQSAKSEHDSADPQRKAVLQQVMASLKLDKMQMVINRISLEEVKTQIQDVKISVDSRIEQLAPTTTQKVLHQRMIKEDSLAKSVQHLTVRVDKIESQMEEFLYNQKLQTQLLEKLVAAPTATQTLDANKKGEKVVEAVATPSQNLNFGGREAASEGEQQPAIVVNPQFFVVKASPSKTKTPTAPLSGEFDFSNLTGEEIEARIEALRKQK